MTTTIQTDGISQESIQKFIEGMTIHNVVWYVNPSSIHLFISPDPLRGPLSLLTITALDDGVLHIGLEGPDAQRNDRDEFDPYEGEE